MVNSTPQLRHVLFDKLGLQPQKKTKTGFSTDAASLEKLRGEHPIIEALLRYREVEKLRSTYGESLLAEVGARRPHPRHLQPDRRPHRPALVRPPEPPQHPGSQRGGPALPAGLHPRRGLPVPGRRLQPDRAPGHRPPGGGPRPHRGLPAGTDIHKATAARSTASTGEVTIAMRSKAKMVSYGLAYGMEAFGLAQRLGIPSEPRRRDPRRLFVAYPAVRAYMDGRRRGPRARLHRDAFGRRRHDPELSSSTYSVRRPANARP